MIFGFFFYSLIILLLSAVWSVHSAAFGTEIHCTRTVAIQGEANEMDSRGKQIRAKSVSSADMILKETLCLNFTVRIAL